MTVTEKIETGVFGIVMISLPAIMLAAHLLEG
jgi:hypothetical protein